MKKKCKKCKVVKELKDFTKNYSTKKDGFPTGDGYRATCKICNNKTRKKAYDNNPVTRMMMNTKSRAKQRNIKFNLSYEDIIIPELCPILKVPFEIGTKTKYSFSPTIDRIDPDKGYIKGNIKVISMLANKMKNNATRDQCLQFAKNIKNYYDDIV